MSDNKRVPVIKLKLSLKKEELKQTEDNQQANHPLAPPENLNFTYRPFKLIPLLPPGTVYTLLIPSLTLSSLSSNPAIKRNALWRHPRSPPSVFTDDSDACCILQHSQLIIEEGKDLELTFQVISPSEAIEGDLNENITNVRTWPHHDGNYIQLQSWSFILK